jgi:hypothetical protein
MEWREMKVVVLAGVLAMACVQAHAESDAEAAFRAAKAWTVRVQVERTVSFVEDEPGAFQGAGFVVDAERGWILTNAHVAGRSPTNLKIAFEGGKLIPSRRSAIRSAPLAIRGGFASPARAESPRPSVRASAPTCCRRTRRSTPATPAARF